MKFKPDPQKFNSAPGQESGGISPQELHPANLPMDAKKQEYIECVKRQSSTILIGETGSGKTTKTPEYLLEAFPEAKIAFTSPRVIPALEVSEYVADGLGQKVGQDIGVVTREERNVGDTSRLIFMTDGVLLSMFKKDPMLMEFDIVTVDEAHERSLNIDLCLGLLKKAQKTRKEKGEKELKIIVASATIEEQKFVDYFGEAPPLKVPGRMYPVDVKYVPIGLDTNGKPEADEFAAAKLAKHIVSNKGEGDILIFMPGEQEIQRTVEEIEDLMGSNGDVVVLPLYSSMQKKDKKKVFQTYNKRKIIISTNIAETSLTIPGVRHVIDTGTVKQMNYNPDSGLDELKLIKTSQANMNQRKGRAGRTAPGTCYRLMNEDEFNARKPFQQAEILRANLGEAVLRMKDMGIDDVEGFDFIENPSRASIHDALEQLRRIGALDKEDKITDVGKEMAHFQMRPDLARMLIEAKSLGCVEEMVDLCSMISSTKPIMIAGKPDEAETSSERERVLEQMNNQERLKVPESDLLTSLNVWNEWVNSNYDVRFAVDHLLNFPALKEVGLMRMQLLKRLAEHGVEAGKSKEVTDIDKILKCLLAGSPESIFYSTDTGRSYFPFNNDPATSNAQIFPGSVVFKNGQTLIMSLNVSRTEKKVRDRYTDEMVTQSRLWAKNCHKLKFTDMEKLVPGSVEERKGEMRRGVYGGEYYQIYNIYVFGKLLSSREEKVEGYYPEESYRRSFYQGRYDKGLRGRDFPFVVSPGTLANVLPELIAKNYAVRQSLESYRTRGGGSVSFSSAQEDMLDEPSLFYQEVISKFNIKTKDDVLAHEKDFEIKAADFLSEEQMDAIDKDCPHTISNAGVTFAISYTYAHYGDGERTATVMIADPKDLEALSTAEIPPFKAMDKIVLSLSYTPVQATTYRYGYGQSKATIQFKTIEELRDYNEQYKKAEAKRERRHERKRGDNSVETFDEEDEVNTTPPTLINNEAKPVEKNQEKVESIRLEIADIRSLLAYLRKSTEEKTERELKDKTKILERIKEISAKSVEINKKLEEDTTAVLDSGSLGELLSAVRALSKRLGIAPQKAEQLPYLYKHNQNLLLEAAERNEVEKDDSLLKKIATKSIERAFQNNTLFTEEEADEVIIELL